MRERAEIDARDPKLTSPIGDNSEGRLAVGQTISCPGRPVL
jgi:hypothetical protein